MRTFGTESALLCILCILAGSLIGGMLGDTLGSASLGALGPVLSQHHEIFNVQHMEVNIYIVQLTFSLRFAPNVLSIIGMLIALFLYRRIR